MLQFLYVTTQSVRLYLITLSLEKKNYWFGIMSGKVLNFGSKNQCELLLMYPELNRNKNQPWEATPHPLGNCLLLDLLSPRNFRCPPWRELGIRILPGTTHYNFFGDYSRHRITTSKIWPNIFKFQFMSTFAIRCSRRQEQFQNLNTALNNKKWTINR